MSVRELPAPIARPSGIAGTPYEGLADLILQESRRRDEIEQLRRDAEDERRAVYERERREFAQQLESHAALIAQMRELMELSAGRFGDLAARFTSMELDLKAIRAQIVEIGTHMGVMKSAVDRQDDELGKMRERLAALELDMIGVKRDMERLLQHEGIDPTRVVVGDDPVLGADSQPPSTEPGGGG